MTSAARSSPLTVAHLIECFTSVCTRAFRILASTGVSSTSAAFLESPKKGLKVDTTRDLSMVLVE